MMHRIIILDFIRYYYIIDFDLRVRNCNTFLLPYYYEELRYFSLLGNILTFTKLFHMLKFEKNDDIIFQRHNCNKLC